ncbi:hypothetical protein N2152v2_007016 [Parachlorella kessleri]
MPGAWTAQQQLLLKVELFKENEQVLMASLQAGKNEDDMVREQLAVLSPELRDKYREKVKTKLLERAEELRRERAARARKFELGKQAYARGQYPTSTQLLERALDDEGPFSQLGGEIQLWLALAYQACGREQDCIDVYLGLEKTHPIPSIRKQASSWLDEQQSLLTRLGSPGTALKQVAADLRYIMEAPKLQLSPDERVQIPVLEGLEANRGGRTPTARPRPIGGGARSVPKSWDEVFWENYRPPRYLANKYVFVASMVLAGALAWYSAFIY